MRAFSLVTPQLWIGNTGKALRAYPADVRELAIYLVTGPHHDMYGYYYLPVETASLDMGRSPRVIANGFQTLEALGFCAYDVATSWVWVLEMAKYQLRLPLLPRDYRAVAAARWYAALPLTKLVGLYWDRYVDDLHLGARRGLSPTESVSACEHRETEGAVVSLLQPLMSMSGSVSSTSTPKKRVPTNVQGAEPVNGTHVRKLMPATVRFERFWNAYPKHIGKKAAREMWDRLMPDDATTDIIVAAVERHKLSNRWLREGGTFVPDPVRYLRHERWSDDLSEGPLFSKQTLANCAAPLGSFLDGLEGPDK